MHANNFHNQKVKNYSTSKTFQNLINIFDIFRFFKVYSKRWTKNDQKQCDISHAKNSNRDCGPGSKESAAVINNSIKSIESGSDHDDDETSPVTMRFNVGLHKYPELAHFRNSEKNSRLIKWELLMDEMETFDDTNKWLNSSVIDSFMIARKTSSMTWKKVSFFPLICTISILGDLRDSKKDRNFFPFTLDMEFENFIYVPYTYKNHYCLIVMKRSTQSISLYDPFGRGNKNDLKLFLEYLENCKLYYPNTKNNISSIQWKIIPPCNDRPIQTDGVSCGLYIAYYMDQLAKEELSAISPFHPNEYRNLMKDVLKRHSLPLEQLCIGCTREDVKLLFTCDKCKRKVHKQCYIKCFFGPNTCLMCAGFKKSRVGRVRDIGFPNKGNDCWFNAVFQVIFRLPTFDDFENWYIGQNSVVNQILRIKRNLEIYDVPEKKIYADMR